MNPKEARDQRNRFNKWKERAINKLIPLLAQYFATPAIQKVEVTRKAGRIVERLHNPYFDILNHKGDHMEPTEIIAARIFLQLETEEFCQYMKKFGS